MNLFHIKELRKSPYWKAKAHRAQYYFQHIYGFRETACGACSGSGIYDNTGSPPCGCCEGTGVETFPGPLRRGGVNKLFAEQSPLLYLVYNGGWYELRN